MTIAVDFDEAIILSERQVKGARMQKFAAWSFEFLEWGHKLYVFIIGHDLQNKCIWKGSEGWSFLTLYYVALKCAKKWQMDRSAHF